MAVDALNPPPRMPLGRRERVPHSVRAPLKCRMGGRAFRAPSRALLGSRSCAPYGQGRRLLDVQESVTTSLLLLGRRSKGGVPKYRSVLPFLSNVLLLLSCGFRVLCEVRLARCPSHAALPKHRRHSWFAIDNSRASEGLQRPPSTCQGCPRALQDLPRPSSGFLRALEDPSRPFKDFQGPSKTSKSEDFHLPPETVQVRPRAFQVFPKAPKDGQGAPQTASPVDMMGRTGTSIVAAVGRLDARRVVQADPERGQGGTLQAVGAAQHRRRPARLA